ncbi:MAG: aldehyde dehydrogenase family protein [Pantoea sp.]|uniref:aldehyde dehydrogenase family protein n=1 Tax=Pantoea sp. TaxID=69393 RepID=UPI0023A3731F|nr:aldehyde dehydrogenase family protein [Pantoea sp.]MDE1186850.1 aldehyde dehydrogenase family protein [Pantoea sp.]
MSAPAPHASDANVVHFIHGEGVAASGGRTQPVWNPAAGRIARHVALASEQMVNRAAASAASAQAGRADAPPSRRARILNRFLDLMNRHADERAAIITAEHGKVFSDARGEVGRGNTAREFARRVQAGMVGINVPIPVPMAWHGFGGWKRSLFGDMPATL